MSGISSGSKSLAVCDRCHSKMPYQRLRSDGNSPGLRVCQDCWDVKSPYRLPARKTENVSIAKPRPDADLSFDTNYILTENGFVISTNGELLTNG